MDFVVFAILGITMTLGGYLLLLLALDVTQNAFNNRWYAVRSTGKDTFIHMTRWTPSGDYFGVYLPKQATGAPQQLAQRALGTGAASGAAYTVGGQSGNQGR